MDKKGFLLAEEALKIFLALIAITFLVYFLASLYFSHTNNKTLGIASDNLAALISEVEDDNVITPELKEPYGWKLSSWGAGDLPNSCSNFGWDTCLCLCPNKWLKNDIEECDEKGVCMKSKISVIEDLRIEGISLKLNVAGDGNGGYVLSKDES